MVDTPRFLSREKLKNRKYRWVYCPPSDILKEGISKRKTFNDYRLAKKYAEEENLKIDEFRDGHIAVSVLSSKHSISQAVGSYKDTSHFRSLSENSIKAYSQGFRSICSTPISDKKTFGSVKIKDINPSLCQKVYDKWVEEGTAKAQYLVRIFSVLMSYCVSLDLMNHNPMSKIKKVPHKAETSVWTKDQVQRFLDTAFTEFKWRNVGLLILMAYTWCQRPVDIRHLKWVDLNLEEGYVTIKQSKRGATVNLPVSGKLLDLLKQQKETFGFQDYVVPYQARDQQWKPMTGTFMTSRVNEVLSCAGLPKELQAGKLRTTGIQELVDADVDISAIMSVTGHQNIGSLSSYVKPKLSTATMALNKRKTFD